MLTKSNNLAAAGAHSFATVPTRTDLRSSNWQGRPLCNTPARALGGGYSESAIDSLLTSAGRFTPVSAPQRCFVFLVFSLPPAGPCPESVAPSRTWDALSHILCLSPCEDAEDRFRCPVSLPESLVVSLSNLPIFPLQTSGPRRGSGRSTPAASRVCVRMSHTPSPSRNRSALKRDSAEHRIFSGLADDKQESAASAICRERPTEKGDGKRVHRGGKNWRWVEK